YGFGASEALLADALWGEVSRDDVVVATKGGLRRQGTDTVRDCSAPWLRAGVESRLRSLRTDRIDLYQIHWPDPNTPAEETAGSMGPGTTFVADDWRSHSPDFTGERFRRNLQVVDRLKDFARERAISLPQLAVAWTLSNPAVQVAIVGARRPEHLDDTTAAAEINLSGADRREIDRILAGAVPVVGPSPEGM